MTESRLPPTIRLFFDWTSRGVVGDGSRIDVSHELWSELRTATEIDLHHIVLTKVGMKPTISQSDAPAIWSRQLRGDAMFGLWFDGKQYFRSASDMFDRPLVLAVPLSLKSGPPLEITASGVHRYQMTLHGYFEIRAEDAPKAALLEAARNILHPRD